MTGNSAKPREKFEWRILTPLVIVGVAFIFIMQYAASQLAVPTIPPKSAPTTLLARPVSPIPLLPLDTLTTLDNSNLIDLEGLLLRVPVDSLSHTIYHVDGTKKLFGFGFWYPELTPTWLWDQRPAPSPTSFKVLVLSADRTDPSIPLKTAEQIAKGDRWSRRPTPSEMNNRGGDLDAWGDKIVLRPSKKYPELLDASEFIEQMLREHPEREGHYPPPRTPEEVKGLARAAAEREEFARKYPKQYKTWPPANVPPKHDPNDISYEAPLGSSYELSVRCDVSFCRGDVLIKSLNIQYFLQIADNGHLTDAIHAANKLLEAFAKNAANERDLALLKADASSR